MINSTLFTAVIASYRFDRRPLERSYLTCIAATASRRHIYRLQASVEMSHLRTESDAVNRLNAGFRAAASNEHAYTV